ncbi:MAG: hypothetical protein LBJ14_07655 [Desulfarculales bacterium]|jgi:hypothetical protein|nr:hypothetical protein [Desulfarculales bacterium]
MKKILAGAVFLLLLGPGSASLAVRDAASDLRQALANLPPGLQVSCGDIVYDQDKDILSLIQFRLVYELTPAARKEKTASPPSSLLLMSAARIDLFKPNPEAFTPGPAQVLAQRISISQGSLSWPEGVFPPELALWPQSAWKNSVFTSYRGRWGDILARLKEGGARAFLQAALLLLEARAAEAGYEDYSAEMNGLKVSIGESSAEKAGMASASRIQARQITVRAGEAELSIEAMKGEIEADGLTRSRLLAWEAEEGAFSEPPALAPYRFNMEFSGIKGVTLPQLTIFTLKSGLILSEYKEEGAQGRNSAWRYKLDDFQIAPEYMAGLDRDLARLLQGKPLILSLDAGLLLSDRKFSPGHIKISLPHLADFSFAVQALNPAAGLGLREGEGLPGGNIMEINPYEKMTALLGEFGSVQVREMEAVYQDRGFINMALESSFFSLAQPETSLTQARSRCLEEIDRHLQQADGALLRDLLMNLRGLIQRPGRLALNLKPKNPVELSRIVDLVLSRPQDFTYKFTLSK